MTLHKFRLSAEAVFCVSLFFVFACWAFASPNGSTQDDYWHMSSIYCSGSGNEPCDVPSFIKTTPCFSMGPDDPNITPACVDPALLHELAPAIKWNSGSYTGGYYSVMHALQWGSLRQFVFIIRLINALIFISLLRVVFWSSNDKPGVRKAFVGTMIATMSPLFIWFIPSINPTSWSFVGSSLIWVPLIVLSDKGLPVLKRSIAGISAVLLLMLSIASKPEAVMYSLLAVVASFFLVVELRRVRFRIAILIASLIVATTWFVFIKSANFSVIVDGFGQPTALNYLDFYYITHNLPKVIQLYAGQFASTLGDTDVFTPSTSWLLSAVALSIMIAIGVKNMSVRQVAVVSGYAIFVVSVPLLILNLSQRQVGAFIATRYVWALLFGFVFLMLWNPKSNQNPLPRVPVALACAAAHFAAVGALFAVLRRYTVGASSTSWNLDADKLWWWDSAVSPLMLLGLAFIAQSVFFGSAYRILTRPELDQHALTT